MQGVTGRPRGSSEGARSPPSRAARSGTGCRSTRDLLYGLRVGIIDVVSYFFEVVSYFIEVVLYFIEDASHFMQYFKYCNPAEQREASQVVEVLMTSCRV